LLQVAMRALKKTSKHYSTWNRNCWIKRPVGEIAACFEYLSVVEIGRSTDLLPPNLEFSPGSGRQESQVRMFNRNRLQSHEEFWMIAAHDAASSRFSHRSAGED
jgi:hypothetical protein